jgi:glycosyltransferase involved in cell wall biosynthesis
MTTTASPRRELLLIAPTCDGEDVGEAWVAHQWVKRLAPRHDVTLLTYHKRGKTPTSHQLSGLRIVEWEEPSALGRNERLNSMLKPANFWFYGKARRWIQNARARGEHFDLAHQLVPVAMRYPCPAIGTGIPFVIGPVGGSLQTPPGLATDDDTAPWYVGLRALDRVRMRYDPLLRRTYDDAACVLGIAPYALDLLRLRHVRRFEVMSETAIEALPPLPSRSAHGKPVRLLYVGRVVRTKGLRDAIRALPLVRSDAPVVLDVVGDGFDLAACEQLVTELRLDDQVRFHGRLEREHVDAFYRNADIFVFPSYREPGGNVTFEAMSYALPLITSDLGGPGNVVDDTCGIRVHPETTEQFAAALARAIGRLADDPELRHKLGDGARRRVAEIGLWDSKVRHLEALYDDVLCGAGP